MIVREGEVRGSKRGDPTSGGREVVELQGSRANRLLG